MRTFLATLALAVLLAGCSDSGGGGGDDDDGADGGAGGGTAGPTTPGSAAGTGTSGSTMPTAPPPQAVTLEVAATGAYPVNPAFTPSTASVPVGAAVHVVFSNEDLVPVVGHNWVVEGIPDASSDTINPSETTEFDFLAATAGTFAYYCAIGDHRDRGMEGTLTVA